ncbi:hypothetical protein EZL74_12160 [Flavobacterium silvisoli]|uniref:Uncharacterized protein n=1 Tax=Flavobacterium silvisoli TaxID=2529433 RepID=A0A4Q9YPW9_9FLAO|nr:hypothetical protein [Flavobacterium silvisoli]TBX65364.1 hypothetical protein EZL74_12160 [Flavobacterium silvisoli]
MIYIVTLLALFFLILIVYLLNKIQTDRSKYQSKLQVLEEFIIHISQEQRVQNNQLLITQELKQKMKTVNATLSKEIFDLNYQLFEELEAKNK